MSAHPQASPLDQEQQLAALVAKTVGGDEAAWQALWIDLCPLVDAAVGRLRVVDRLPSYADHRRDIATAVMGSLREDGFRRLSMLGERLACRDGSFRSWLKSVVHNASVSHVRAQPEDLGVAHEEGRRWASFEPIPEDLADDRPPPSRGIEARRILAHARSILEPAQLAALCRWLAGDDFGEIAAALELAEGDKGAARLVRSAVKRLRLRFAPKARSASPDEIDQRG
jgi:DNA-directed RNA polymerase specialized sigma24 family protein